MITELSGKVVNMGIFFVTYFISNIAAPDIRIKLSSCDPIINCTDTKQGYVAKSNLLRCYPELVPEKIINDMSYIVEYQIDSYDPRERFNGTETRRLPIR